MGCIDFSYRAYKHYITIPRSGTSIYIISQYFLTEPCSVQAEMDGEQEVEKIRAQGVEQSDLLRNARAGRTNLPLSAAEKPSSYF